MVSAGRSANDLDGSIKERMEAATVWALPARWYADPDIYRIE